MKKIKRDTTKDLFFAVLKLVKENGHYNKAAAIMDYVLPNEKEDNVREDIELSAYEFDFDTSAQFGSSEGIYIDCYLSGKYTEIELKRYNSGKGIVEPETRRSVGTFKTLKTDIESMKIMGELCGALVFYARQYVNENLDRYTPAYELEHQKRIENCSLARSRYIRKLFEDMTSGNIARSCEECIGNKHCTGKQDGCLNGIKEFLRRKTGKYYSYTRYSSEEHIKYYDFLDGMFDTIIDCFDEYVNILMAKFPDISIYQALGYVFTWLCTRKQKFTFYFTGYAKKNSECNRYEKSYENLNTHEQKEAFKLVKEQILKETVANDADIGNITDDNVLYYVKECIYFYENGILAFEY